MKETICKPMTDCLFMRSVREGEQPYDRTDEHGNRCVAALPPWLYFDGVAARRIDRDDKQWAGNHPLPLDPQPAPDA